MTVPVRKVDERMVCELRHRKPGISAETRMG